MLMPKTMTKLEAARRQLDCAIRLYLNEEDLAAVHTLTWAALTILRDLTVATGRDGRSRAFGSVGLDIDRRAANFLKHANKDPEASLLDIEAFIPEFVFREAVLLYKDLAGEITQEMDVAYTLSDLKYGFKIDHEEFAAERREKLRQLERQVENAWDDEEREEAAKQLRLEVESQQGGLLMFGRKLLGKKSSV